MDSRVVNLRDYRGRDLPDDVVRVDRRTRWGNPYKVGGLHPVHGYPMTRSVAVHEYALWLRDVLRADATFIEPLRGKRLACWCAPDLCHAEAILEQLDATAAGSSPA